MTNKSRHPQTSSRRPPHALYFNSERIESSTPPPPATSAKAIKWFTATGPAAFFPTTERTTTTTTAKPKTRRPRIRPQSAESNKSNSGDHFNFKSFKKGGGGNGKKFGKNSVIKPKRSSKAAAKAIIVQVRWSWEILPIYAEGCCFPSYLNP